VPVIVQFSFNRSNKERFAVSIQKNAFIEELPRIYVPPPTSRNRAEFSRGDYQRERTRYCFKKSIDESTFHNITQCLLRNNCSNHVDLLLTTPRRPAPPVQQRPHQPYSNGSNRRSSHNTATATTMWIKTCHKAIASFAKKRNKAGASSIFKLLRARPGLLEKRLKPPPQPAAAAAAAVATSSTLNPRHPPPRENFAQHTAKKSRHADESDASASSPARLSPEALETTSDAAEAGAATAVPTTTAASSSSSSCCPSFHTMRLWQIKSMPRMKGAATNEE
jgi:hypothetical protein